MNLGTLKSKKYPKWRRHMTSSFQFKIESLEVIALILKTTKKVTKLTIKNSFYFHQRTEVIRPIANLKTGETGEYRE